MPKIKINGKKLPEPYITADHKWLCEEIIDHTCGNSLFDDTWVLQMLDKDRVTQAQLDGINNIYDAWVR